MKYYIATGLENHQAHNQLRDMLNGLGHKITYDWTEHGPVWQKGQGACRQVALKELAGVEAADTVIVLMPGGRGTHIELGAALIKSKRILFYSAEDKDHWVNEKFCAFYAHPGIVHFKIWEDLTGYLKNG